MKFYSNGGWVNFVCYILFMKYYVGAKHVGEMNTALQLPSVTSALAVDSRPAEATWQLLAGQGYKTIPQPVLYIYSKCSTLLHIGKGTELGVGVNGKR